jgi:hypothetical protein
MSAVGCGGSGGGVSAQATSTPEATLQTLKTALANKDFVTFAGCLSDEALAETAGQMRVMAIAFQELGSMATAMGGEGAAKAGEMTAKIDAIMKKHVPADAPALDVMKMPDSPEASRAMAREAGQVVADQKAFVAEFIQVLAADSLEQDASGYEVTGLQVEGDLATANIKDTVKNREATLKLRRTGGQWKVDDLGSMGMIPGPEVNAPMPGLPM